jgi:hypothetical protein
MCIRWQSSLPPADSRDHQQHYSIPVRSSATNSVKLPFALFYCLSVFISTSASDALAAGTRATPASCCKSYPRLATSRPCRRLAPA